LVEHTTTYIIEKDYICYNSFFIFLIGLCPPTEEKSIKLELNSPKGSNVSLV